MQTGGEIEESELAAAIWLKARDNAMASAQELADLGVHKSIVNRLIEPWMWITVVMTATEWENFYRLRCHPDAEIHFQKIAGMIREAIAASTPRKLAAGEWHLPFWDEADWQRLHQSDIAYLAGGWNLPFSKDPMATKLEIARRVSVARVARVSYEAHGESERKFENDLKLFNRLVAGSGFGHWSPHGHICEAAKTRVRSGPFVGFKQYRKLFANECADVVKPDWAIGLRATAKMENHRLYGVTAEVIDRLPEGTYGMETRRPGLADGLLVLKLIGNYHGCGLTDGALIIEPADNWKTA